MADNETSNQIKPEEMQLLYKVTTNDLAILKQRQWMVTNYAILLYASLIAVGKQPLPQQLLVCEKVILTILGTLTLFAGFFLLHELQSAIEYRRDRLEEACSDFCDKFKKARNIGAKPPDSVKMFLYSVLVVGLGIVAWVLWRI